MKNISSISEQEICITCGLCCDGTIFYNAVLEPGEKGNLPEKIEQQYFSKDDKEYFRLPCLYFDGKCTIYHSKKAVVCSAYRCQLLKDFADKKITRNEALDIIKNALKMREDIYQQYKTISGINNKTWFKQILSDIGKTIEEKSEVKSVNRDYTEIIALCNIYEALLIKHFRSAKDFESMIATDENQI